LAISLLTVLLVSESIFFSHIVFYKKEAQARIEILQQEIPSTIPKDPILYVAWDKEGPFWETEIDAMLLAQELGWPTLNGFSGNFPPGYSTPSSCSRLPERIKSFMQFNGELDESYYLEIINHRQTIIKLILRRTN